MVFFTLGTWLLIWNCILLLGQIRILRKKFKPIQLLQISLSVLFGWFTDFGLWLAGFIPANFYPVRLLLVVAGTVLLGFGIALSVIANVLMNSGEAFVKAIADETKFAFGNVKIVFDVTNVVPALLISLLLFRGDGRYAGGHRHCRIMHRSFRKVLPKTVAKAAKQTFGDRIKQKDFPTETVVSVGIFVVLFC